MLSLILFNYCIVIFVDHQLVMLSYVFTYKDQVIFQLGFLVNDSNRLPFWLDYLFLTRDEIIFETREIY